MCRFGTPRQRPLEESRPSVEFKRATLTPRGTELATKIPAPSTPEGSRPPELLIVDDEDAIRDMLQRHFSYLGYEVATVDCARSALAILEMQPADVVISDITMPGMNGIDLLRKIRAGKLARHVIMMTGFVTQSNVIGCMEAGADTCIFKPIQRIALLEEAVQRAVDDQVRWWQVLAELRQLRTKRSA